MTKTNNKRIIAFFIMLSIIFVQVFGVGYTKAIKVYAEGASPADTSRFGEVLVSDSGTNPTIQQGNTSRKLAVAPNGTIYAVYRCNEGIKVAKSTNNGKSFDASVLVYSGSYEAEISVSSNGIVYVGWVEGGQAKLAKSTNGAVTFSSPITVGTAASTVHMAVDGSYIYIIDRTGQYFYSSSDNGDKFTSYNFGESYVYSDVHVDPNNHNVIVQKDNPSIRYYVSTDRGKNFGAAVVPAGQSVYYSVGSIASTTAGSYLLIAGQGSTGVKINLTDGTVSNPNMGNNLTSQGRSLSDDYYGNVTTGYSDGTYVYFIVSNDYGNKFGTAVQVAQTTVANASINSTNGDVLFLYERAGKVYLKVYGDKLVGYDLNVSNSSLYFDSDNNQNTASVSVRCVATDPLTINSINIEGDFSLDRSAIGSKMTNNQTADINVTFTPTHTGTSTGRIIINYGSPAKERIINLTGVKTKAIDSTPPTVSVTGNPSDWTKESVTLTVNASDAASGLASDAYSFDGGQTWQSENTKTYEENTSNIVIKVKDKAGNIATYETINITKIDKTGPNAAVIANKDKYTEDKWFNENQTITASFTKTAGCDEKLQYKVDDSPWTDGEAVTINEEGKHAVSFRVIDELGQTSEEQTVKVNLDKTAPTNAKITVKDRGFTSFLNKITFGIFFNETVDVSITADGNISGINKIEYQRVSSESDYNPNGTWTSGNSFNVNPDEKFVVYAKVTDNAGNYVIVNTDGIIVDATKPALTLKSDAQDWTANGVSVNIKVSDNFEGIKEVSYTTDEAIPQSGTVIITNGEGTITLANEGHYKLIVTAKDNSLNEASETINIKIDKTKPVITGATESLSYFIGRVIKLTDDLGEIAEATYQNGTDPATSFKDGDLFEKAGKYTLTLRDKAGNSNTLFFEIKALPKVEDVVYTTDCKKLIDTIREEFKNHNDLPEPYKTDIENKIKALEDRYSQLDKEVMKIKLETSVIKDKLDALPNGVDGLISQEGKIRELLSDIGKLTKEQQNILKAQRDLLNSLLDKINILKEEVGTVGKMINALPAPDKITKNDSEDINKINKSISNLTNEQKELLGSDLIKRFNDALEALRKLMLHDANTDLTVIGIDGTSFGPDVYLVVTPIKQDSSKAMFSSASKSIENASKTIPELKGKELGALYDVSLFRDNIKIQPDGKVKVKIKIPENLRNRTGLDIVHIADNGTVTLMNATVEGEYLVFITTHFSDYAIVANAIAKEMPKTGSAVDLNSLLIGGILFSIFGLVLIRRKTKKS